MRNIFIVVGDIYDVILNSQEQIEKSDKKYIINDIKNLYDSMCYAPPESIHSSFYFGGLQEIMNAYISQDDYIENDWCRKCIDIFLNPSYGSDKKIV